MLEETFAPIMNSRVNSHAREYMRNIISREYIVIYSFYRYYARFKQAHIFILLFLNT